MKLCYVRLYNIILHYCKDRAQDEEDGGIADRPGDVPDVFHTFFGLAGLSLLRKADLAAIHPVYALPSVFNSTDATTRLAL